MNKFNKKDGDWIFKIVPWFIGFVFICILTGWIVFGVIASKVFSEVSDEGLKSVVENVWCGKQQDCKLELKGNSE